MPDPDADLLPPDDHAVIRAAGTPTQAMDRPPSTASTTPVM